MVEDTITDGRRIAELLASELTGLERGVLADVAVVDADADVTPTAEGAQAYSIALADETVGAVAVTPETALVSVAGLVDGDATAGLEAVGHPHLAVEQTARGPRLRIDRGAAVKAAVDVIERSLAAAST